MPASSSSSAAGTTEPKLLAEQVRPTDFDMLEDDGFELSEHAVKKKWQGTAADRRDMSALGRVQQLRVRSSAFSATAS